MSNKLFRILLIIILFLMAVIIIWGPRPQKMNKQSFSYDQRNNAFLLPECVALSGITTEKWELAYPQTIGFEESFEITLTKLKNTAEMENSEQNPCDLIIVTQLELIGVIIEPGEKIYTSYDPLKWTRMNWRVTATSKELNGKIWVYAQTNSEMVNDPLVPLFVLPIEMEVISFLEIDPAFASKIAGVAIFFFALTLLFSTVRSR